MNIELCDFCLKKITTKPKASISIHHYNIGRMAHEVRVELTKKIEEKGKEIECDICEECFDSIIVAFKKVKAEKIKKEIVVGR